MPWPAVLAEILLSTALAKTDLKLSGTAACPRAMMRLLAWERVMPVQLAMFCSRVTWCRRHVSSHSSLGKLPPALMAARYVSISVIDLATAWPSMMQPGPGSWKG